MLDGSARRASHAARTEKYFTLDAVELHDRLHASNALAAFSTIQSAVERLLDFKQGCIIYPELDDKRHCSCTEHSRAASSLAQKAVTGHLVTSANGMSQDWTSDICQSRKYFSVDSTPKPAVTASSDHAPTLGKPCLQLMSKSLWGEAEFASHCIVKREQCCRMARPFMAHVKLVGATAKN